jgi:topoisomerase IA-like protein
MHMAKYGKKAGQKVKRAMHERKRGQLKSGRSGKTVKSKKQAIAIGLSEARREGAKVPAKRSSKKKAGRKASSRKSTGRKSSRKSASKK